MALALVPALSASAAPRDPLRAIRLDDPRDEYAVRRAILGAMSRLDDGRCRAVFSDFSDASGRRLQDVLDAAQETAQARLQHLLFYDGSRQEGCRPPSPIAFTAPGSRVIFVCGREFRAAAERNLAVADAVIIHELLHSLGLGENPPTPKEITDAVLARCAR